MTREEAIQELLCLCDEMPSMECYDWKIALEMAIEALKQQPCEDAISRQAVLDLVVANHIELNGVNVVMYSPLCKDIKQLSPVKLQEPKTGHWIDREVYDADRWKCSGCGRTEPYKENFCPNCGAKMVDPQESEDKECSR